MRERYKKERKRKRTKWERYKQRMTDIYINTERGREEKIGERKEEKRERRREKGGGGGRKETEER